MGNRSASQVACEDEDAYPWLQLCQFVAESSPPQTVLIYDIQAVKVPIHYRDMSFSFQVAVFEASSPPEQLEDALVRVRNDAVTFRHFSVIEPANDVGGSDIPFLVDLANGLMDRIPDLKRVRTRLVPKILSEDLFWERYFSIIQSVVFKTISASSQ